MKKHQGGFTIVEGLLILVIVGLLGGTGWYVMHSQKQVDQSYSNTNNSVPVPNAKSRNTMKSDTQSFSLDNGSVKLEYSSLWKVEADSNSNTTGHCALAVVSQEKCNDSKTLTLKSENNFATYSTDSFNVQVLSFPNQGKGLKQWLNSALDDDVDSEIAHQGAEYKELTINNLPAAYYAVKPDPANPNRLDVYYAVVTPTKAVVVSTELFRGDHYSFKNSNDYFKYSNDVDSLAKTIRVN